MDSMEVKQKSFLLKEEMKVALGDLSLQSSIEALSKHVLEDHEFSDTPFLKISASDPTLNLHEASSSVAFFDTPFPDNTGVGGSNDNGESDRDNIKDSIINQDDLKPEDLKFKTRYIIHRHTKEKCIVCIGVISVILLLVWNGSIAWLIQTMYSYPRPTFAWKIMLELLFMWINSISKDCDVYTENIIVNSIEHCIRQEIHMNCPYEVQFSGGLGIFLFLLAISTLNTILASVFLGSRKTRKKFRFFGTYVIRNSTILCCWISLWLLLPFIMSFYSSFSKLEAEMDDSINEMSPPDFIPLWWNKTQIYSQCCGIKNYEDWETKNGTYPISCCNDVQKKCKTLPSSEQVWQNGCYDEEYQRLQFFGGLFIAMWVLKIISEFVLFCVLCKIFGSYTIPDNRKLTSSITINGYKIEVYGNMDIKCVPNRHQIIIEMKCDTEECVDMKKKQISKRGFSILMEQKKKLSGYVKVIALDNESVKDVVVSDFIRSKNNNNSIFLIEI